MTGKSLTTVFPAPFLSSVTGNLSATIFWSSSVLLSFSSSLSESLLFSLTGVNEKLS